MPKTNVLIGCSFVCALANMAAAEEVLEEVMIGYMGGIAELVVLEPDQTSLICSTGLQPARVELLQDQRSQMHSGYFARPVPPEDEGTATIRVRRASETVREVVVARSQNAEDPILETPVQLQPAPPSNWLVQLDVALDVCLGLGSLDTMSLEVTLAHAVGDFVSRSHTIIQGPSTNPMEPDDGENNVMLYGTWPYPMLLFSLLAAPLHDDVGTNTYTFDQRLGSFTILVDLGDMTYTRASDGSTIDADVTVLLAFDLVTGAAPSEPIYSPR